ncbi:DMT family transporter [Seohaeicola zhoushanensis]|uniref:Membrane protein n=1 Tax=Seohaeicola zhoushanensis TaxID=1569283 RepID=A0A8J3MAK2_9RHOB|nr:DMT family transporter [Seohaeicola zhoushanensis]GHF57817.1 membrane protein [Seohaeicola zhoushanensis]
MADLTALTRTRTAWNAQSPTLRGALLMVVSTLGFAVMHATIRHVSAELPPFVIVFFRNFFGLLFLVPLLLTSGFAQLRTRRLGLHALRGLLNICAMLMFFTAVSTTPLARVTALNFSAPIFAAVLSVVVLGEGFRFYRWAAIAAGFLGTLIVLRPGLSEIVPGDLLTLGSAFFWACAMIVIKILSRTESSVAIVFYMGVFLCGFSIGPALWAWEDWPSWQAWGWLLLIGLAGSVAQVTISQALKEAEPTAVLPFDFLKLVWASLLALWLFGEVPDSYTFIGAGLIFASGLFIAHRERSGAKAQAKL